MKRPAGQHDTAAVGRRDPAFMVLILFLLAAGILLWALLLPRAERSVFGRVPILDEVYYLDRAMELRGGGLCPAEPCFMSPLYPQLIRLTGSAVPVPEDRAVDPGALRGIRLFQAGCWVGTVLLLAWIGRRDLAPPDAGPRLRLAAAALPALLFFLYRPAAAYATAVLMEIPLTFLVTLALALAPGRDPGDRPGPVRLLALGVVVGAAALLRGTALAILPVAVGWIALRERRRSRGRVALAVVIPTAGALLVMLPAVVHNSRLAGRLSPPTLNAGVNLYIGNGPDANGFYVTSVNGDWRRDPAGRQFLAEQLGREELSLAEADSVWSARARRAIGENPARAAGLWLKKVWLHLQAWEIDQQLPLEAWTRQTRYGGLLFVSYGLLVAVGLGYGLWRLGRRPGGPAAMWMLAILLIVGLQSVFFVVSRYRQLVVPMWVLLAGGMVLDRSLSARARVVMVACGVLVTVPWGLGGVRDLWAAMARANEARRWAQVGVAEDSRQDLLHAATLYRQALARGAVGPAAWQGLVAVDLALEDKAAAAADLDSALAVWPRDPDLLGQKAADLLAAGRQEEARPLLQRVLEVRPRDPDALHNLAVLLARRGDVDRALEYAGRLKRGHPGDVRGFVDLGVILARRGRTEEARQVFLDGLARHPGDATLRRNLEILDAKNSP